MNSNHLFLSWYWMTRHRGQKKKKHEKKKKKRKEKKKKKQFVCRVSYALQSSFTYCTHPGQQNKLACIERHMLITKAVFVDQSAFKTSSSIILSF